MAQEEKRTEWKRIGLCIQCGKNMAAEGRATCQQCLDRMKQNRDYKRAHGLCVKCGRNKAAPNRKYCDECLEWRHNRYVEKEGYSNSDKARCKELRTKRKEAGLCVECGKPAFENHTLCYEHLLAKRNDMRRRRAFEKDTKEN